MSHLIGVFGGSDDDEPTTRPPKTKTSNKPNGDFKKPEKPKNNNTINSGLISVFGGDDDDEPSQKPEKKKSPQKPNQEPKKKENNSGISSNIISVFGGDSDEDKPKRPPQKTPSQKSQEERKTYEKKPKPSADSGLISVFGGDSDEDKPKRPPKKTYSQKSQEERKPYEKKPKPSADSGLVSVFADDEDENGPKKKTPNHHPKAPYDGLFPNKEGSRANQRKERREKRKNRLQYLHPSNKDDGHHGHHRESDEEHHGFDLKVEKPTLIKKTLPGGVESEMSLEEFLKSEYDGYELKPKEEVEHLDQEDDYGNVEYKLKLVHPNQERIEQLTTQMKFRLQEGNGEAKYVIGVEDDGTPKGLSFQEMYRSLKTLCGMASALKADVVILQMRHGYEGKLTELEVRSNQKDGIKLDIKIMLLGDNQSGKSTLIGVLTSGQLDNGNGSARMHVHVHKHEVLTGETSSLSHHIMGFDSQGTVTNHTEYGHPSWEQIVDMSTKVLTFLDIGGHEKYTTKVMSSLCSFYPDYALIVISGTSKVTSVAEQHLKLACIFEMPITIVVTHVDLMTEGEIYNLKSEIERAVREFSEDRYLVVANSEEDNVILSRTLKEKLVIPVFMLSNVDGTNLDLFKSFLNLLPVNNPLSTNINLHSEFYIHAIFHKKDQIILGGTVINGCINKNQVLFLGPDEKGNFRHVEVASIQCKKVSVKSAYCGQSCTIEIKLTNFAQQWADTNKETIRRGMVLVDTKSQPQAAFQFTAEITLLEEKLTKAIIWEGYEPVITSQTTHQACIIDFEGCGPQEMTEEELQKFRQDDNDSNAGSVRKGSLNKETHQRVNDRKHRSKSEDFRDDHEMPSIIRNKKYLGSHFKDEMNMFKTKTESGDENVSMGQSSDFEESKGGDASVTSDDDLRLTKETMSDSGVSTRLVGFKEGDNIQKMTFQEKIKRIKKSVFKDVEELVSKRRKRKFIAIIPDEKKLLKLKFKYHPEYIVKGQKIIINDSTMKAIGIIKDIFYIEDVIEPVKDQ